METHKIEGILTAEELIKLLHGCDIGDIFILKDKGRFLVAPSKQDTKHSPCETCVFNDAAEDCPMRAACMAHKRKDHKSVNFPRQFKA